MFYNTTNTALGVINEQGIPDLQIVIDKNSITKKDYFIEMAKNQDAIKRFTNFFIVKNELSETEKLNLDGFNEIVTIIDNFIKMEN